VASDRRLLFRRLGFQGHGDGRRRNKTDDRFRGYLNPLVPGDCGAYGTCACSYQAADQRALASARYASNQRASTSSATNHRARPLALSFDGLFIFLRAYSVRTDTVELYPQVSRPLESALFMRCDHGAAHRSAGFQYCHSLDTDRLR
jgi:hypothetical protein